MLGYGRDESAPTPGGVFVTHFVGERNIINNPSVALSQTVSSRREPIYRARIYVFATHYRNPFRIHSRNVRNVFVICVLHIRRVKVWFLRHKSMVFGVQKPPFWRARSGFLQSLN